MKMVLGTLVLAASLLPNTINANYDQGSPEHLAYLSVYEPDEFNRVRAMYSDRSDPMNNLLRRQVYNAISSNAFKEHKAELEAELEEYRDSHKQLKISNTGPNSTQLWYYRRKSARSQDVSPRKRVVKPGKKAIITVLKDKLFEIHDIVECPEDCKETSKHTHYSKRHKINDMATFVCLEGGRWTVTVVE